VFSIDIHSFDTFPFPDPLLRSNAWIRASELFKLMVKHLKHNKISFPRFFFLSLGRHEWTINYMVQDYRRVALPVMHDMVPSALLTKNWYPCQLAAGISHLAIPRTTKVITWCSSEYLANGFDWMTLQSWLLRSRQHSRTISRKQRDPPNCHYSALAGTQWNK
jgi:hypothetical protein